MKNNKGFIQIIIAIVIIVLILTFFRVNLRVILESDTGKSNFGYLWELLTKFWDWLWHWVMELGEKLQDWLKQHTRLPNN